MKTSKTIILTFFFLSFFLLVIVFPARSAYHFSGFRGRSPIHIFGRPHKFPVGITPNQIKTIYHLPKNGGQGTIAIIGAYDDLSIEADLQTFSKKFALSSCTLANGCLEKHKMSASITSDRGWVLETSLDVEWAHAIAPQAKILLIEAPTPSGENLLKAVDYAAGRSDVVSVSMSWGGGEFIEETSLDNHFISQSGAQFFAASGDSGAGASWPASSPNVIGVGGSSLVLKNGKFLRERAWSKSGGGISAYEQQPSFQADYKIARSQGMRAVPDVAFAADPKPGFPIVHKNIWRTVGGTSAGAPQWAAIAALGSGISNANFYMDKASPNHAQYFRDITSGSNGDCGYYCKARKHYDYITGLGSPLTAVF